MRVLDLFSGIGGFSLGLERAGLTTIAFCESDRNCQAVLRKHWPRVPIHDDVRTLGRTDPLPRDVDLVCGGFPCQDVSDAGERAGLDGARSSLWYEFLRIIDATGAPYAIIENVSALRTRGLDKVLGSLAAVGYDAEWHCIPASAVGARHRRDRIWIVAFPNADRERLARRSQSHRTAQSRVQAPRRRDSVRLRADAPDAYRAQLARRIADCKTRWPIEPRMDRLVNGVPGSVGELRGYGNAVVPLIPEIIVRALFG